MEIAIIIVLLLVIAVYMVFQHAMTHGHQKITEQKLDVVNDIIREIHLVVSNLAEKKKD